MEKSKLIVDIKSTDGTILQGHICTSCSYRHESKELILNYDTTHFRIINDVEEITIYGFMINN